MAAVVKLFLISSVFALRRFLTRITIWPDTCQCTPGPGPSCVKCAGKDSGRPARCADTRSSTHRWDAARTHTYVFFMYLAFKIPPFFYKLIFINFSFLFRKSLINVTSAGRRSTEARLSTLTYGFTPGTNLSSVSSAGKVSTRKVNNPDVIFKRLHVSRVRMDIIIQTLLEDFCYLLLLSWVLALNWL